MMKKKIIKMKMDFSLHNETNTKEERKNDFDNEGENSANNENSGNEIKEDGNDNEQNKEYNDEFES